MAEQPAHSQPSLDDVKGVISDNYLGRGGIHGVGLSRDPAAIKIYLCRDAEEKSPLLDELRAAAAPFDVIVIRADQSFAH
ncbi:hypothetical protein [Anatilimnocola floriformis]|uniref:hypothetical protein n=1 Tax=Anatilimnocola floriformis TaxID=2948575 RepID=UPI0020C358EA|nr:hypothetical protein [Anatilimnocola floriformis]